MINKTDWKNFKEFLAEDLKQKFESREYKDINDRILAILKTKPNRRNIEDFNFLTMSVKHVLSPKYPATVEGCLDWLISEDNTYE